LLILSMGSTKLSGTATMPHKKQEEALIVPGEANIGCPGFCYFHVQTK